MQVYLSHGSQKSIPSSADTSLVAAINNWVIGHSVKKKKSAYMQGMETQFNSIEWLLVTH